MTMADPHVPGQWRIRLAVILVYMVFGAMLNSVGPIILLVVQTMGVSRAEASLLDAHKDIPIAVASFLVASMLPRIGLKRGMLIGLGAVAIASALVPLLGSFDAVRMMLVALGAGFALVKISAYSIIGLVTRDDRAHAGFTSLLEGMFMIGVLVGYWAFSLAAGPGAEPLAWLKVFWWVLGIAAVAGVLLASSPLDEAAARQPESSRGLADDFWDMWRQLKSGLVAVFLLSAFLYVLIEQGISTWLPSFNAEVLKMPTHMSLSLAVLMPASTALGRLGSSVLMSRFGWYRVVLVCVAAIAALMCLVMPLAAAARPDPQMSWLNAPAAAYLIPLIGLFLAPIYPAINSAMLSACPKPQHAAMTGLIVIFSALGGALGSWTTGQLFVFFDGQTSFTLLLLPLGALLLALRRFRRGLG